MKPSRLCFRSVEFEASADNDGRTLEGYAAVFDHPTRIDSWEGKFDETVIRGAFAKTLSERKPVLQFDHGRDVRTGSVPIGSIQEIREDTKGLYVKARLFDNPTVEPIRQAIEGGAIDGMSFRFKVNQDDWYDSDGKRVRDADLQYMLKDGESTLRRTIREVELYEAGPVVFPAYEATSVGVRSLMSMLSDEERDTLLDELIERAAAKAAPPKKKKKPSDEDPAAAAGKKKPFPPKAEDDDEEDDDDDEDEDVPADKKKPFPPKKGKKPAAGAKPPAKKKKPASKGAYSNIGMDWDERQRDLNSLSPR